MAQKMTDIPTKQNHNIVTRLFLSPDEPRLRAGWRLLLHTLLLGLATSLFLLISLFFSGISGGGTLDISLLALVVELASILLATWFARRFIDRRSFRSLGFNFTQQSWADMSVGFLIPGLLMALIFISELILGWTRFEGWAWQHESISTITLGLVSGFIAFTLVGFSEEILSRGYHLQNLEDGLNLGWALFISSAFFAILHAANPSSSWTSTLGIFLAGLFLAYGWVRTRQLWLSIGLHIGWNFFEGTIFGFPVSGLPTFRLIEHSPNGPPLITGGAFGPEAGLIILPAMALGLYLIYRYTQGRQPQKHSAVTSDPAIQHSP
jgi:membrane protease YdiL (CAAX protease family)